MVTSIIITLVTIKDMTMVQEESITGYDVRGNRSISLWTTINITLVTSIVTLVTSIVTLVTYSSSWLHRNKRQT